MEEEIKNEIDELVKIGERIVASALSLRSSMAGNELAEATAWVTRLGQIIRKLYGTDSQQFTNYTHALNTNNFYSIHSNWNAHISQMFGIANTIKHDYEKGLLSNKEKNRGRCYLHCKNFLTMWWGFNRVILYPDRPA